MKAILLIFAAIAPLRIAIALAESPATQPASDEQRMLDWWDDLEKSDPAASRALLNFSDKPAQSVAFFKERLKPLVISEDDVNKLIADLGSEDEAVWKHAFEKLEYFDPRLTIDLQTLMNNTTEPNSRTRLVEILSERPPDSLLGKSVSLRALGTEDGFNFSDGRGSWWAEHHVERLNSGGWSSKKKWTRACRAIVLLEHIRSPEAIGLLKEMATGNPDAEPTKAAIEALDSLQSGDK